MPDFPQHHRVALRRRLDQEGRVEFTTGARGTIERADETGLRVSWPGRRQTQYVNDLCWDQLRRAYTLALEGPEEPKRPPPRHPQPKSTRDFGDDPPF